VQPPGNGYGQEWTIVLDTATGDPRGLAGSPVAETANTITTGSRVVLERAA
jgi:hypothetical protein